MKGLEVEKDMKIKHSVSSPPYNVRGNVFCKKALHGGTKLFGANLWAMFYMGTNDQIMQVGKLAGS